MSRMKALANVALRESNLRPSNIILAILLLMPLAGCSNDGAGGPIISSLSTPTDPAAELDSDQAPNSEVEDLGGEEDPMITMTPTAGGVTAHLTWDRPSNFQVTGYSIHYGKRSSEEPSSEELGSEESSLEESGAEEPSSCSQGESHAVEASPATIMGLEPNTRYFFAIRAISESGSICSNEITVVTPGTVS